MINYQIKQELSIIWAWWGLGVRPETTRLINGPALKRAIDNLFCRYELMP